MREDKAKLKKEFKHRLYHFVLRLIELIEKLPPDNISRRIGDQLLRSGTSVMGNYIEGQSSSSKKDFANFFNHSLKSANESKLWVAILRDSRRIKQIDAEWFLKELDEISKIFASSILTLKKQK